MEAQQICVGIKHYHYHHLLSQVFLSPGTSLLVPLVHPTTLRLQFSDYSIFLVMCDAPGTAVFVVDNQLDILLLLLLLL
jgi:hypothetical protein